MIKDLDLFYIATNAESIFRSIRWEDGPVCPVCGSKHYYTSKSGRYICKDCHKNYSITTNTLLHGSHISISYWLVALYLILEGKGISSLELARKLQITQTTAYYMLKRLRFGLNQDDVFLKNNIAMDEVYLGGTFSRMTLKKKQYLIKKYDLPRHPKNIKEKQSVANAINALYKTPVFGMNDGNQIVLKIMTENVATTFKRHTEGIGIAVSDCSTIYKDWEKRTGWNLETNNHSKGQYLTEFGNSSNRVEGEFAWLKRSFLHNYVHIDKRCMQGYLNEFCFRWNHRNESMNDKLMAAIKKISQKVNIQDLRRFNQEEVETYYKYKLVRPWDYFETMPVSEIKLGELVYRREDYLDYKQGR